MHTRPLTEHVLSLQGQIPLEAKMHFFYLYSLQLDGLSDGLSPHVNKIFFLKMLGILSELSEATDGINYLKTFI